MASGNGISGLLNFQIFWGGIPPDPLETGVTGAPLACPPAHKFLATAMSKPHPRPLMATAGVAESEKPLAPSGYWRLVLLFWAPVRNPLSFFSVQSQSSSAGAVNDDIDEGEGRGSVID